MVILQKNFFQPKLKLLSSGGLDVLTEERKRSMDREMGLDGSTEEENAAKLIQNKSRSVMAKLITNTLSYICFLML